ncbi:MAG: hypothetical protein FWF99_01710 [Desulfovibrionaceae bacterium]|nr:hypothetical protein [Desulfovibrionaceae bacterium]
MKLRNLVFPLILLVLFVPLFFEVGTGNAASTSDFVGKWDCETAMGDPFETQISRNSEGQFSFTTSGPGGVGKPVQVTFISGMLVDNSGNRLVIDGTGILHIAAIASCKRK